MNTKLDERFDTKNLYDRYYVRIKIRNRIDGGVPKSRDMIRAWVVSRTKHDDKQTEEQINEHLEDLDAMVEEVSEGLWTTFKRDERGPYIEARQIKAMLRESATLLGITKKKRGSRQIVQHGFEIKAQDGGLKIHLEGCDEIKSEEKAIRVMTPQGPRSALKKTDYATDVELAFEVWILTTAPQETRHIGEKELIAMLTHAQENGLGANRSQTSGKFQVITFETL